MEKAKNGSNFKLFFFFNFSVFHLIFYFNFFFLFSFSYLFILIFFFLFTFIYFNFFFLFIYIFSLVARLTQGEVSRLGRRFKTGINGNEDSRSGTRPGMKIQDRDQWKQRFKIGDKTVRLGTRFKTGNIEDRI